MLVANLAEREGVPDCHVGDVWKVTIVGDNVGHSAAMQRMYDWKL